MVDDYFISEFPFKVLTTILNSNGDGIKLCDVSKKSGIVLCTVDKWVSIFMTDSLIREKRIGRYRLLFLTVRGKKVADCLLSLKNF